VRLKFHGVPKGENTPKRDIVDTKSARLLRPGIIRTNNMAFLLYGSGLDEQEGRKHKKTNGRKINGFDYYCATILMLIGVRRVLVEPIGKSLIEGIIFCEKR